MVFVASLPKNQGFLLNSLKTEAKHQEILVYG